MFKNYCEGDNDDWIADVESLSLKIMESCQIVLVFFTPVCL
jgi:hypothetical protein